MVHVATSLGEVFGRRGIGEAGFQGVPSFVPIKLLLYRICQKDKFKIEKDYAESHSVSDQVVI